MLSADEVERLLGALERPKYRVFFTLVYATGLRVREACQLETRDIDAARGAIYVRQAKRKKERFVMLSPRLLAILRAYWRATRPPGAVGLRDTHRSPPRRHHCASRAEARGGEGRRREEGHTSRASSPASRRTCSKAARILRVIQVLLGHGSIKTTTRYARVSTGLIASTTSPLDRLKTG